MKQRILTGWTFQRALFVIIGAMILFQALQTMEWVGIIAGGYFTAMGIFGFGCAAGACSYYPENKDRIGKEKVEFEEIKK